MSKLKIYLAASFAFPDKELSEQRKEYIKKAAEILRKRGFEVFIPHEHKIPNGENLSNFHWAYKVQMMDKMALHAADWVVILSFGKSGNNGGVAWEAGYAYGLNKNILLVKRIMNIESQNFVEKLIYQLNDLGLDDFIKWFKANKKILKQEYQNGK